MLRREAIELELEQARELLKNELPKINEPIGLDGHLPLHIAIEGNDIYLLQQLLELNADVNAVDINGNDAVALVIKFDQHSMLEKILEAKLQPNLDRHINTEHQTLLHSLSVNTEKGMDKYIFDLVKAGANINVRDVHGKTPLHYAAENKNSVMVDAIIDAGANIQLTDNNGMTPLKHDASNPGLHAGPRIKSQATQDLEKVLLAFMNPETPKYLVNSLNEIEISIGKDTYNFSKILEHKPDFEQIDLSTMTPEQNATTLAYMQDLTTYQISDTELLPEDRDNMTIYAVTMLDDQLEDMPEKGELKITHDDDGIICKVFSNGTTHHIPWNELSANFPKIFSAADDIKEHLPNILEIITSVPASQAISETEARTIRYYAMQDNSSRAYEKINRFLRENGKITDLEAPETADLKSIMLTIAFLPQAIMKLKQDGSENTQQLFRGENYINNQTANRVITTRTEQIITDSPGFISTSIDRKIINDFIYLNEDRKNTRTIFVQPTNAQGVDISRFTETKNEKEVLFTHGTQTLYRKTTVTPGTLIATTARSIDEIYPNNYQRPLIQLREKMIKNNDEFKKDNKHNPSVARLMDDFCRQVLTYSASELVDTSILCKKFIEKTEQMLTSAKDGTKETLQTFHINLIEMKRNTNLTIDKTMTDHQENLIKAAQYAYDNHFSKPYDPEHTKIFEEDVQLRIIEKISDEHKDHTIEHAIERPNHGLAHAMRKALYAPAVINSLQSHATNNDFKHYLSSMDKSKLDLIQLALLFSVSGRKSDAGSTQNKKLYKEYRQISQQNFIDFASLQGFYVNNPTTDTQRIQNNAVAMFAEQIQNMGDVKFLAKVKIEAGKEQALRNAGHKPENSITPNEKEYLFHIIKWCHNLDMLRSIDVGKFKGILAATIKHSAYLVDNHFETKAVPTLLNMAQQSIHATGDRSLTTYENGKLTGNFSNYDETIYPKTSKDAIACMAACQQNTPVMMQVLNGKINIDTLPKGISMTPIQTALLNCDIVIDELMLNPALSTDDASEFIQLIYRNMTSDFANDNEVAKLEAFLSPTNNLDPADLIAALRATINADDETLFQMLIDNHADVNYVDANGYSALHYAISDGKTYLAEKLIPLTANINDSDNDGNTPLMTAVGLKYWGTVSHLVDSPNIDLSSAQGAHALLFAIGNEQYEVAVSILSKNPSLDFTYADGVGNTVFHFAAASDNIDIINALVQQAPNINQLNDEGLSPLMIACQSKSWDIVAALLNSDTIDVNIRDQSGNTPLHLVALAGKPALIHLLVNQGAYTNEPNDDEDTPIDYLIKNSRSETDAILSLDALINDGANLLTDNMYTPLEMTYAKRQTEVFDHLLDLAQNGIDVGINARNVDTDATILHTVSESNDYHSAKLLITAGADLNAVDINAHPPSFYAARSGNASLTAYILEKTDADKVNHIDKDGNTLLTYAAQKNKWDVVTNLLKLDLIDINIKNEGGYGLIDIAAKNSQWEIVTSLLEKTSIDILTVQDLAPVLFAACKDGKLDIVKQLDAMGLSLNTLTTNDYIHTSPLHLAAENNRLEVVNYMLEKKVDIINETETGYTAFHTAAERGNLKIIEALINAGFNINITTNAGDNQHKAILIAADNDQWPIVELLLAQKNIDITGSNNQQMNILHLAAYAGKADIVYKILAINNQHNPAPLNLNDKNSGEKTALEVADLRGKKDIVEILKHHGNANQEAKDSIDFTKSRNMGLTLFGEKKSGIKPAPENSPELKRK